MFTKVLIPVLILLVSAIIVTGCSGNSATTSILPTASATITTPTAPSATSTTPATIKPATTVPAITTPATNTSPTTQPVSGIQQYGGTLRYVTASGPGAPFGAPWLSNGSSSFGMQFSEEMLIKEMADASLVPNLATSWDLVSEGANPSITIHLAKGVKFHDGSDFNAQAVKWNLDKAMSPGSTLLGSTNNWKSIEVVDDSTLRINLKSWQNTALTTFTTSTGFMVSPTAFDKNGADWMNYNMVGTGAFIQKDFKRDVVVSHVKNPNYREKEKPFVDVLDYIFVSDALTAEALFRSGGADILQSYSDVMTNRFRTTGNIIIAAKVANGTSMWWDSANADSPWSNLKVRNAAEYAIDKESLAKTFGFGNWTPAYQSVGQFSPAYDPNLVPRKYDVAKAKQLMTEAGYPSGFKTTIFVSPFSSQDIAVAIQAMWKAVGINADLQFPQASAFSAMLTGTWKNGVLFGPGAGSTNPLVGWNLTYAPGSAWFQSVKRPPEIADLFKAALAAPKLDPVLVRKVEAAIYNDNTIMPLWLAPMTWIVTDKVKDSGLGDRGSFWQFEPQNTWLSK